MNTDLSLLAALLLIALCHQPAVCLPLIQEDIKELLFGGTGVVPDDDPVDHST